MHKLCVQSSEVGRAITIKLLDICDTAAEEMRIVGEKKKELKEDEQEVGVILWVTSNIPLGSSKVGKSIV